MPSKSCGWEWRRRSFLNNIWGHGTKRRGNVHYKSHASESISPGHGHILSSSTYFDFRSCRLVVPVIPCDPQYTRVAQECFPPGTSTWTFTPRKSRFTYNWEAVAAKTGGFISKWKYQSCVGIESRSNTKCYSEVVEGGEISKGDKGLRTES